MGDNQDAKCQPLPKSLNRLEFLEHAVSGSLHRPWHWPKFRLIPYQTAKARISV